MRLAGSNQSSSANTLSSALTVKPLWRLIVDNFSSTSIRHIENTSLRVGGHAAPFQTDNIVLECSAGKVCDFPCDIRSEVLSEMSVPPESF